MEYFCYSLMLSKYTSSPSQGSQATRCEIFLSAQRSPIYGTDDANIPPVAWPWILLFVSWVRSACGRSKSSCKCEYTRSTSAPPGSVTTRKIIMGDCTDLRSQVALINAVLFLASVGVFMWILSFNALRRREVIADAIHYPLPGCPSVHSGIEWAQWIPGE